MTDNQKSESLIEHRGIEVVPPSERTTGFWDMFAIWAGFSIVMTNFMFGSMGAVIGIVPAIIAEFIGTVFVALVIYAGTAIASKYGVAGAVAQRASLGINGRIIPSIAIWICGFGWFGVQTAIVGTGFDQVLTTLVPGIPAMPKLWMVVWGLLMGLVAIYGYKAIVWLNRMAVPGMVVLIILVLYAVFGVHFDKLAAFKPDYSLSFTAVINLLPAGMAAALILGFDYGRYANGPKAVLAAPLSVIVFFIIVPTVGILAAATAGTWDPVQVLANLGLGVWGVILMILASWTTNVSNVYVAGLGISNLTGMGRIPGSIISTALGIVLALAGIFSFQGILTWLTFITATLIPASGIFLMDYYVRLKGQLDISELMKGRDSKYWFSGGWNTRALIAWIVGAAAAIKLPADWIPAITSMIIAGAVYYILILVAPPAQATLEQPNRKMPA